VLKFDRHDICVLFLHYEKICAYRYKYISLLLKDHSKVRVEKYTAKPMSEAIAVDDGELLILFESGAPFYKDDGRINPTDRIFRMTVLSVYPSFQQPALSASSAWMLLRSMFDLNAASEA
jgi:hypothetical protein